MSPLEDEGIQINNPSSRDVALVALQNAHHTIALSILCRSLLLLLLIVSPKRQYCKGRRLFAEIIPSSLFEPSSSLLEYFFFCCVCVSMYSTNPASLKLHISTVPAVCFKLLRVELMLERQSAVKHVSVDSFFARPFLLFATAGEKKEEKKKLF